MYLDLRPSVTNINTNL